MGNSVVQNELLKYRYFPKCLLLTEKGGLLLLKMETKILTFY